MTAQYRNPTRVGDVITLPGGERARVTETGITEHVITHKDGKRVVVRSGYLHTVPA